MNASIVIVNWNTCELLGDCLGSIIANPPAGPYDVWVVDNASQDGSAGMVRERFPQVQLIENRVNRGFAAANNQAIRRSAGRFVVLLNPDTEVRPEALPRLVRFMEEHPAAGAAGARLLNPDGRLQFSCSPAPTLLREFRRVFHLPGVRPDGYCAMEGWDLARPRQVDVLLGACLILRRSALEAVGLLDEDYFMYSEEVDLCHRLRKEGWELYWAPLAEVVHHGGQSTRQAAAEMFLRLYQGKLIYFRKHYGRPAALAYKLILAAASLSRVLISPVAWLERPARRKEHLLLAKNYKQLLFSLSEL